MMATLRTWALCAAVLASAPARYSRLWAGILARPPVTRMLRDTTTPRHRAPELVAIHHQRTPTANTSVVRVTRPDQPAARVRCARREQVGELTDAAEHRDAVHTAVEE